MKLFQRLLVAPAALGLLSPLAANATEVNLNEISNYSDVDSIEFANSFDNEETTENTLLAGGEGLVDSHSGGFSETTTASFSADFMIGAVDGLGISTGVTDGDEDVQAVYNFNIGLNTSFTGEDSLDIAIDTGNAPLTGSPLSYAGPLLEFAPETTADTLTVDGVSYTFPVGDKTTVIVGDNTDASALFTTACVYGGPSDTLDDCGNVNAGVTGGGTAIGASYDFGNGFTAAVGYAGAGDTTGLGTAATLDVLGVNAAYTTDTYGVSLTYGSVEATAADDNVYTALNAYWTPEGYPSFSVGYEIGDLGGESAATDESINYFVGIEFGEVGPGTFGAAIGTSGGQQEGSEEELMYEAYYSYPVNDGMTITPLVYIKEQATAGTPDQTGIMVKTSFSF